MGDMFGMSALINAGNSQLQNAQNMAWQANQNAINRELSRQQFDMSMAQQREQNDANREQAMEMFISGQQFSADQADLARRHDFAVMAQNQQNWFDQADYNSYANQVLRAKEAGLNPTAVIGQGQFSGVSTGANSGAVGSSSPVSPSMAGAPNAGSFGTDNSLHLNPDGFGSMLSGMGNLIKGMSDAKRANIDVKFLEDSFNARLLQEAERAENSRLLNAGLMLDNFVKENVKDVKVKHAFQEFQKSVADTYLSLSMGKYYDESAVEQHALALLHSVDANLHGAQATLAKMQIGTYYKELQARLANMAASTQQMSTQAQVNVAIKDLTVIRKDAAKLDFSLASNREVVTNRLNALIKTSSVDYEHKRIMEKRLQELNTFHDSEPFARQLDDILWYIGDVLHGSVGVTLKP